MSVDDRTLREFLDSGRKLNEDTVPFWNLEDFAVTMMMGRRNCTAEALRERAEGARQYAEAMTDHPEFALGLSWEAEILEDHDLGDQFEAALPVDLFDQALARATTDKVRSEIRVQVFDIFECWTCGESRIAGPAIVVVEAGAGDLGEFDGAVNWELRRDRPDAVICLSCIDGAVARARRAR